MFTAHVGLTGSALAASRRVKLSWSGPWEALSPELRKAHWVSIGVLCFLTSKRVCWAPGTAKKNKQCEPSSKVFEKS